MSLLFIFFKETIKVKDVLSASPNLVNYAAPILIFLALVEAFISFRQKKGYYETKDFLASLAIGLIYILQSTGVKIVMFALILFVYNIMPWSIPVTWYSYVICFIILDFVRWYSHKVGHETNLFWATHVTHHNSEKYNLSTGFRISWTQQIKIIFFIPISMMGFHPVVFFICHQIAVLYQFWIHTEYIRKTPRWFRYVMVTPSHHRVHHGKNEKYLDKNYGSTFIIWDRMFGTFQPEEEQAIYGVIDQPEGYNPVKLVFHVWGDVFRNMRQAKGIKGALKVLIQRPSTLKK